MSLCLFGGQNRSARINGKTEAAPPVCMLALFRLPRKERTAGAASVFVFLSISRDGREGARQNAAYSGFSAGRVAMHSISMIQPGRHTGASTMTFGVSGKRAANIAFTTA